MIMLSEKEKQFRHDAAEFICLVKNKQSNQKYVVMNHESGLPVIVGNGLAIGIGSRDEYYPGK